MNRKERILITSLLTAIVFAGLQAQTSATATPKLVIGLTIDQLRADYIEAFSQLYGEKGFKRLFKEGRVYMNAEYDFFSPDPSSATAAIYTGTTPYYNGIVGDYWMDRNSLSVVKSVDDRAFMGIYTSESTSPQHLDVSNLSDELKVATGGKSEIYAIAPTREMAVLSAGHAADGAFWINNETGKWSGSTYYGSFPQWVTKFNDREGLDFRIGNLIWQPYLPVTSYQYVTSQAKPLTFKHKFGDERHEKYRKFKTSPYINDEVNRLVSACLTYTRVGADYVPDFLALSYYAGNYDSRMINESPMEIQDMYVRLDHSLGDLLDIVEKKVGLQNTLFFVTSTGYRPSGKVDDSAYRIPTGEFHIKRCAALLNMYLMAIYGQGQYVDAYLDDQIYLNHKLIEDKKLSLSEVMKRSEEFVMQMSGVRAAYSAQRLLLGAWEPRIDKIRHSFSKKASGDLYIEVMPGWSVVNDFSNTTSIVRDAYASVPLIFLGPSIKPEILYTPVKIATVAPTVAHFMRIRAPNAASASPLTGICK